MKLHEKLLMERKRKGLKQKYVAGIAGISPGYYSRIERGTDVKLSTLAKICRAMEVDLYVGIGDYPALNGVEL